MNTIGERLIHIRKKLEKAPRWSVLYSGEDKAEKHNAAGRVQYYEEVSPTIEYLILWHNRGYNINWILTGEGEPRLAKSNKYKVIAGVVFDLISQLSGDRKTKKILQDEISSLCSELDDLKDKYTKAMEDNNELRSDIVELLKTISKRPD